MLKGKKLHKMLATAVTVGLLTQTSLVGYAQSETSVSYDQCIRDTANNTNGMFQFNSKTGHYKFTQCDDGTVITGQGMIVNNDILKADMQHQTAAQSQLPLLGLSQPQNLLNIGGLLALPLGLIGQLLSVLPLGPVTGLLGGLLGGALGGGGGLGGGLLGGLLPGGGNQQGGGLFGSSRQPELPVTLMDSREDRVIFASVSADPNKKEGLATVLRPGSKVKSVVDAGTSTNSAPACGCRY